MWKFFFFGRLRRILLTPVWTSSVVQQLECDGDSCACLWRQVWQASVCFTVPSLCTVVVVLPRILSFYKHGLICACHTAEGIQLAQRDGVDWILHIDTDELVYPGGAPEYSLQRLLGSVPEDVDSLVFPNYESMPERDDVSEPFTEVGCSCCAGYQQTARAAAGCA